MAAPGPRGEPAARPHGRPPRLTDTGDARALPAPVTLHRGRRGEGAAPGRARPRPGRDPLHGEREARPGRPEPGAPRHLRRLHSRVPVRGGVALPAPPGPRCGTSSPPPRRPAPDRPPTLSSPPPPPPPPPGGGGGARSTSAPG